MKKLIFFFLVNLLPNMLFAQSDFHQDILLIKIKDGINLNIIQKVDSLGSKIVITGISILDQVNAKVNCESINHLYTDVPTEGLERWYIFKFKTQMSIENIYDLYSKLNNCFEYVEKCPVARVGFIPNDPLFNSTNSKAAYDINLPQAWNIEQGNPNVVVGIIDNG